MKEPVPKIKPAFRQVLASCSLVLTLIAQVDLGSAASMNPRFQKARDAYASADYETAAREFHLCASEQPASGTLQNLGLAEWQRGKVGNAVLAWEQALWLDPFNGAARNNLRFARKAAQIEGPDLTWNEVVSTWLPVNWWAWIAGLSLWMSVGIVTLPAVLRQPKAAWHQAVAAFGVMLFLLSIPAHLGVHTRSRIAYILPKQAPLRLTPTAEGEAVTQLGAGEPVRCVRVRGRYALVRTSRSSGWVQQEQLGRISP